MIWPGGEPETGCGVGSTMGATEHVRLWLPGALERLGVERLLDAPCGDRNWIRRVALPCAYIGVDHEPSHVERAGDDGTEVWMVDIRSDALPECDAILSRDFFQHLSRADAAAALTNFLATGAKWLITTCHGAEDEGDIVTGEFRRIDWRKAWGEPIDRCADGKFGRILGVWAL